jgi:hypothetical protein
MEIKKTGLNSPVRKFLIKFLSAIGDPARNTMLPRTLFIPRLS